MSKSDWKYFNCSEKHEHDYVVSLYPKEKQELVRSYLRHWCNIGTINNSTHEEVYALIKKVLNLDKK
ncbi:MAG: hypothetical protein HUJ87_13990 [Fusobacterium varium]|uniref:hypothetical protein n=1 Tax=Fusobacterium varium TaxID=856 RepID=UPI00242F650D|nr:hypothetical protein [Fusobacterium varium]MCF0171601.1 hypothetical protein [Fusobacterium varium]